MVIFGFVEVGEFCYLCHSIRAPLACFVNGLNGFHGQLFLFLVVIKNSRAVLSSSIGTLSVQCCRIMNHEKDFKQLRKRNNARIEIYLNSFSMTGCLVANFFIGWVFNEPTRISRLHFRYAIYICVYGFHAPKTSTSKGSDFQRIVHFNFHNFSFGIFFVRLRARG